MTWIYHASVYIIFLTILIVICIFIESFTKNIVRHIGLITNWLFLVNSRHVDSILPIPVEYYCWWQQNRTKCMKCCQELAWPDAEFATKRSSCGINLHWGGNENESQWRNILKFCFIQRFFDKIIRKWTLLYFPKSFHKIHFYTKHH